MHFSKSSHSSGAISLLIWIDRKDGFGAGFTLFSIEVIIGLDKHKISAQNCKYFLTYNFLAYVLGAQKNRLVSMRRFF